MTSVESTPRQPPAPLAVGLAFAAVYLIWGSTYLTIRIAVESMPPFLMAAARFVIAGVLLLAATRLVHRRGASRERITWVHWRSAIIIGGCLLLGGNGIVSWAEQYVASGYMALIVATVPLFMALFAPLFGGRRVTAIAAVGVAVGLAGVGLLLHPSGGPLRWQSIAAVGSPLLWSMGSLYAQRAPLPRSALTSTGMQMIAGGLLLFIASAASGELGGVDVGAVTMRSWIAFAYLILFGALVGYSCYIWLLSKVSATAVSTYAYVNPLVAVVLGAVVLGESITPVTLGAGAMIVFAVALIITSRARSRHRPATPVAPPMRDVA